MEDLGLVSEYLIQTPLPMQLYLNLCNYRICYGLTLHFIYVTNGGSS